MYVPFAKAVMRRLVASSTGSPGVAQTYVYTFRSAVTDRSITATISDPNISASDLVNEFAVAFADQVTVKLVTSGGAAARHHRVLLEVEEIP